LEIISFLGKCNRYCIIISFIDEATSGSVKDWCIFVGFSLRAS
jgi:hypothetical protein